MCCVICLQLMNRSRTAKISILFALSFLAVPAVAAALVNINTATLAELETLPGVGASIAQSIVDNRPYASIEEVSRASGIGEPGSSSYEKIKNLIMVAAAGTSDTQTQTQTQTSQVSSSAASTSVFLAGGNAPPAITVSVRGPHSTTIGAGSYFDAQAYGYQGEPLTANVRYVWSFGDGGSAEGRRVFHAYAYPGRYAVQLSAGYDYSVAIARLSVEATAGALTAAAENDGSLLLTNLSQSEVDIGQWSFSQDNARFFVPEGTYILAGESVRFAPAVLGFAAGPGTELYYPNASFAMRAAPAADSPLRGERVPPPARKAPLVGVPGKAHVSTVPLSAERASQGAAVAQTGQTPWMPLAGLVLLLGAGAGGAYYLRPKAPVTWPQEEEFELE